MSKEPKTVKHPDDCQCGNHEAHTQQFRAELEPKTANQINTPLTGAVEVPSTSPMYLDGDGQWKFRKDLKDCTKCREQIRQQLIEEIAEDVIEPIINFYITKAENKKYALEICRQVRRKYGLH